MKKNRFLVLILLSLIFASCKNDKYNLIDQRLKSKIDEISQLESYQIGPYEFGDPEKPNMNHPYFYLKDSAKIENLRLLNDYPNSLVRIYSFRALTARTDSLIFETLKQHLTDTAKVDVCDYDCIWSSTVADEMIDIALRKLSNTQKDSLRDLIVLKYNYLSNTVRILYNINPIEKYYAVVRKLAEQNYDESAYIALASYKKQKDVPLIKKGFEKFNIYRGEIFKVVELFPDTAFLPTLFEYHKTRMKENMDNIDFAYYYKALAHYQRKDCLDVLLDMSQKKYYSSEHYWRSNKEDILKALHKYYCPLYKKSYSKLKSELPDFEMKYIDLPEYRDEDIWGKTYSR